MRTCDKCGCYLPDGWDECPACGLMTYETKPEEMTDLQYAFHLLRSMKPFDGNVPVEERSRAFEIVDVNTADARTTHFPVPKPRNKTVRCFNVETQEWEWVAQKPLNKCAIHRPATLGTERIH